MKPCLVRLLMVAGLFVFASAQAAPLRWTMVNVNAGPGQGDAHLLQLSPSVRILVDTGSAGQGIERFLAEQGIRSLSAIVITHAHRDHYGALLGILDSGVRVERVLMNLPRRETCDREKPWGCDFDELAELARSLGKRKVALAGLKAGDVLWRSGKARLEVLYAYDGVSTPVGKTCVNDMSALLKLTNGKVSALLTGDLNRPLGEYLAKHGKKLSADILKVPHHGTESLAPNEFFDRVGAKAALVPSPKELWLSDRSKRVREYFGGKKIPTYVNGIDGHVTVEMEESGYRISTESRRS